MVANVARGCASDPCPLLLPCSLALPALSAAPACQSPTGAPAVQADIDLGKGAGLAVSAAYWRPDPANANLPSVTASSLGVGGQMPNRLATLPHRPRYYSVPEKFRSRSWCPPRSPQRSITQDGAIGDPIGSIGVAIVSPAAVILNLCFVRNGSKDTVMGRAFRSSGGVAVPRS